MVEKIKKKKIKIIINKWIFDYYILFFLVILYLPVVNDNRIIQSCLNSFTAKFLKSNSNYQRVINCGKAGNAYFTIPEKIRINNGIKENYNDNNQYNLTEKENIVEYFWDNISMTSCGWMFYYC